MKEDRDHRLDLRRFLPTTRKESLLRGWEEFDVILFSGDAYVDHPSYGAAVIGRVLESMGLQVALVPQPNWRDDLRDFKKMGRPRLFFAVTAGNMDSMVNHYTANKRLRSNDAYSAGGKSGFRPDHALTTYGNILKKLYPDTPLVIGGIEASLRRLTHYDYWLDRLQPSVLQSSKADLLIYGMGELPLRELVHLLQKGVPFEHITTLPQSVTLRDSVDTGAEETIQLHSHEDCVKSKVLFAENFKHIETESNRKRARRMVQAVGSKFLVVNPPERVLSEQEHDDLYELPFTYYPHPKYRGKQIPSYEMIRFSINIHRGCFGGCSFCTISAHQGKEIVSRSEESVMKEVKRICKMPEFKGYISDLGGPSANMYRMQGHDKKQCEACIRPSCIFPKICKNLNADHAPLLKLYDRVKALPAIKKAFIGSGVRYDMLLAPELDERYMKSAALYMRTLIRDHVSGRLTVAPEHSSEEVLRLMRKPSFKLFKRFNRIFEQENKREGLKQQLIPYFISAHPGCMEMDMAELTAETKALNFRLEQVQSFTPTPMTLATVMYYSGLHPYTGKRVFSAKTKEEKLKQLSYFFWYKKENRKPLIASLKRGGRLDLVKRIFGV